MQNPEVSDLELRLLIEAIMKFMREDTEDLERKKTGYRYKVFIQRFVGQIVDKHWHWRWAAT